MQLSPAHAKRHSILIVEDEEPIAQIAELILSNAGYNVQVAHNPKYALDIVRERFPDILVLDLMMPGLNGFELLSQMKSRFALPAQRVIMISAMLDPETPQRALLAGVYCFLRKPFTPGQLTTAVASRIVAIEAQNQISREAGFLTDSDTTDYDDGTEYSAY